MRLWADDVGTGVMQRLDWAGCPRWLPHVIGSWCWTSAVNSVWDYQWPASSFSVWLQYGDWETNVPIGRKHKMLASEELCLEPAQHGFCHILLVKVPCPAKIQGVDIEMLALDGAVSRPHCKRTRGMGDIVAAAIFGETVCHAFSPIFLAFPACSYSKRQRALGMIPCMEQLPNINYYWPLSCQRYHVNKYKRVSLRCHFFSYYVQSFQLFFWSPVTIV